MVEWKPRILRFRWLKGIQSTKPSRDSHSWMNCIKGLRTRAFLRNEANNCTYFQTDDMPRRCQEPGFDARYKPKPRSHAQDGPRWSQRI
jgi:hypothetical protein